MRLTESINEVYLNAQEFSRIHAIEDSIARDRFAKFYHWYYFPHIDIFAPSKFIGYKNTTLENYKGNGSGTETQKVLEEWFTQLEPESDEFKRLREKLEVFSKTLDRNLNTRLYNGNGGIYLLKESFRVTDYPEEVTDEKNTIFLEGAKRDVVVNHFERNPRARSKCIEHYGAKCCVCTLDFGERYGVELGKGFIHVHHIKELSSIGKEYKIDPIKDLRPVCPNCHAMLHRRTPALSPEKLTKMLKHIKKHA
jgi:predicted HNH restriction endonuclease